MSLIKEEEIEEKIKNITLKHPRNPFTHFVISEIELYKSNNKETKINMLQFNKICSEYGGIFSNCKSLISIPDISKWNISNIKIMDRMFENCSSLKSLPDLSKWDISKVESMKDMFKGCSDLLKIPSKFIK